MRELTVHFTDGTIETLECRSKSERLELLEDFLLDGRDYVFWRRTAQDGSTLEESV